MPQQPSTRLPDGLNHRLNRRFAELRRFESTRRMERSAIYREIREEVERLLSCVVQENCRDQERPSRRREADGQAVRAVAWNIERGNQFEGIVETLGNHPLMKFADVYLITEVDHGMVRSGNRIVAAEMARRLSLNYVFVPCYLSLVKGSGLEYDTQGDNRQALHGNALFSPHPLRGAHALALPPGKDLMRGKEKRLGYQQAVVAVVEHPESPFYAVSLHLDAHSSQRHRHRQMRLVLDHIDSLPEKMPVLLGGDWNTTTFNASRAAYSILGYARRVLMGVRNVVENHYPYPDRYFEKALFGELVERGYRYRDVNLPGGCTLHYDLDDVALTTNMADWVPGWCFWFINWALRRVGGNCSMKLDWFAVRGFQPADQGHPPAVLAEVHTRKNPLSDHDPVLVDLDRVELSA